MVIPDHVMEKQLEDTLVLLSVRTGFYYTLNASGARMWRLLREGCPAADVAGIVAAEYGEARERVQRDLSQLVADLEAEGLMRSR